MHSIYYKEKVPGWLQPEYCVKEAAPEVTCTYPPSALLLGMVDALAAPAAAATNARLVNLEGI